MDTNRLTTRSPSFEPREIYAEATVPFALDVAPSRFKFATAILSSAAMEIQEYVSLFFMFILFPIGLSKVTAPLWAPKDHVVLGGGATGEAPFLESYRPSC
jgi:hypothetical protein